MHGRRSMSQGRERPRHTPQAHPPAQWVAMHGGNINAGTLYAHSHCGIVTRANSPSRLRLPLVLCWLQDRRHSIGHGPTYQQVTQQEGARKAHSIPYGGNTERRRESDTHRRLGGMGSNFFCFAAAYLAPAFLFTHGTFFKKAKTAARRIADSRYICGKIFAELCAK